MKKNADKNRAIQTVSGGAGRDFCRNCGRGIIWVRTDGRLGKVAIHEIVTEEEDLICDERGCSNAELAERAAAIWNENEK